MTCRIRKISPVEDLYLDRQGQREKAAKFKSQEAAEAFAVKHEIEVYRIF